jgi:hypothetical protein
MGLFSDLVSFGAGNPEGAFGIPSIGDTIKGFSGQTGAEAALASSQLQAGLAREQMELFRPMVEAGIAQIPELARGATAEGFGQNIGQILQGGALDPLIAERQRAAEATLSARGLRRSGAAAQAAADIPADLALQVEQELTRRRQSIAGQGQTGAGAQAQLGQNVGAILSQGQLGAAQAQAQGSQNIASLAGTLFQAFSDVRLKENIKNVGELGGLNVVSWTWNKAANDMGLEGESVGFIAQDVQKLYPQHTSFRDGLLTIDYDGLLQEVKHG